MKTLKKLTLIPVIALVLVSFSFYTCNSPDNEGHKLIKELKAEGLSAQVISAESFLKGTPPLYFDSIAGAEYKPSYNEEPEIPAQCWIETNYGTQNACKYCHTDYLAKIQHGNAYPISEDQEVYSFPSPNLNEILWQNVIYPKNIEKRLTAEGIAIPNIEDVEYVRYDNWTPAFEMARGNGQNHCINDQSPNSNFILFPALNPNHLYPYTKENPTSNGMHGFIDNQGFVQTENEQYTGWRAVNFFPYTLFTPLTGSVSGIYIRLPEKFMSTKGEVNIDIYAQNLNILEQNIKNQQFKQKHYVGDASDVKVKKGFYPVGTEFAHPLHYVDLNADGEAGLSIDGVVSNNSYQYEFPGTRSKRVKEIRYMYKWKDLELKDIEEKDNEDAFGSYIGAEGQGWIDNGGGWIIAAFIENRQGRLRPQTTEELSQCLGCHAKVGSTVDAIWSFQRKLPDMEGWADMNYGHYSSKDPGKTKLHDYLNERAQMGELGYFYHTVIGAELFGVMTAEIRNELIQFAKNSNITLPFAAATILDDEVLKWMPKEERKPRLLARQVLMREYVRNMEYMQYCKEDDNYYIKGDIFYPLPETMKANIQGYRKIVLDQSFNLGKDVFGSSDDHVPFTFRSDGTVIDKNGAIIPVGKVIYSRPYNEEGEGTTLTGIVEGNAFDISGNPVSSYSDEDELSGKIRFSGTLDRYYNPILSDKPIRK